MLFQYFYLAIYYPLFVVVQLAHVIIAYNGNMNDIVCTNCHSERLLVLVNSFVSSDTHFIQLSNTCLCRKYGFLKLLQKPDQAKKLVGESSILLKKPNLLFVWTVEAAAQSL